MENFPISYLLRAEVALLITTLFYFLMNGAGIFETVVLVPKWTKNPPESFQLFRGKYGIDLKTFWIAMHSVHEITFIVAIVFCWELDSIRNELLILFVLHFAIRVWTLLYFAPTIIEFHKIAQLNSSVNTTNLIKRSIRWKNWNYLRTFLFIFVSVGLIYIYFQLRQMPLNL